MKSMRWFKPALFTGAASLAGSSFISFQPLGVRKTEAAKDGMTAATSKSKAQNNDMIADIVPAKAGSPLKLRQVHVFFRHGDRSPILIPGHLSTETPKDWEARIQPTAKWMEQRTYANGNELPFGQLTRKGAQQAREVGQMLRQRYGELLELPVEPGNDPTWLRMRSTDFRRTHMTGFYVLSGLLDSESRAGKVKFNFRGQTQETLCVHTDLCPRLSQLWKSVWKEVCQLTKVDDKVQEGGWRAKYQKEKHIMADFLGIPSSGSFPWLLALDYMQCRNAHGDSLPQGLSLGALQKIRYHILQDHVECIKVERVLPFFGGRMVTELHHEMKEAVEHGRKIEPLQPRLALYSAHDITLVPLAVCLGSSLETWPPYASVMCFELWSTGDSGSHFVRVLYNWKEMALPAPSGKDIGLRSGEVSKPARSTLVSWKTFSNILSKHMLDNIDFQYHCDSLPEVPKEGTKSLTGMRVPSAL